MSTLTGTGWCLRLAVRRNRVYWIVWILCLASLMPVTAQQYSTLVPAGSDARTTLEPLGHQPSMLALLGPAFDLSTKAGFVFWRVGGFASCFAGMMAGLSIIRATRAEEEDGRLELLRAGAIGRHAPLASGIALGLLGSLTLCVVTAAWNLSAGLPTGGSLAAGLALAGNGLVFTGIGAVCAQVFDSARTARFWTLGVFFGGMFLARMVIDGSLASWAPTARWFVPLEWGMLIRPYAGDRWWVALLPLLLSAALCGSAFALESHRDHGAGVRHGRLGSKHAPSWLSGAWGLAWRLHRMSLVTWAVSILLCGMGIGSMMVQASSTISQNPSVGDRVERMGGSADITTSFYIAMLSMMATVVALMAATLLGAVRSEETHGRTEAMLATATSRTAYLLSYLLPTLLASSLTLVAVGAVLPLAQARTSGDWEPLRTYAGSAAGLLPGLLLVVGIAVLLIGWLPRRFGLVWVVLGWTMFTSFFAGMFDLPDWVTRLSPWGYLSVLPRDAMDWTPFLVELALALALIVMGVVGYRRRSIPA